jgi:hypothetical protein
VFGVISLVERVWRTSEKRYLRLLPEAIGVRPRDWKEIRLTTAQAQSKEQTFMPPPSVELRRRDEGCARRAGWG